MRFDTGPDWVEIVGVSRRPIRELLAMEIEGFISAHKRLIEYTKDAHFVDQTGNVCDWREDVSSLSIAQWDWWKEQVWNCAHQEKASPEA